MCVFDSVENGRRGCWVGPEVSVRYERMDGRKIYIVDVESLVG